MKKKNNKIILLIIIVIIAIIAFVVVNRIINKKDMVKIEEISEADFKYYKLRDNKKYGIIDRDGNIIIEPQYEDIIIPNPTKDVFIYTNKIDGENTEWKAINEKNEEILSEYNNVEAIKINEISSNVPYEKSVLKYKQNNLYGLIDYSGSKKLQAEYEEIENIDYKEGYLKIKKDGLYGIATIEGKIIVKPEYYDLMADGYYNKESKYSKAGFIVETKSDEGYKYGYINTKGKKVLETNYNDIMRIASIDDEKSAYIITSLNGKYGLIKDGKEILSNEYDNLEYNENIKELVITKDNKQGVSTIDGKILLQPEYDYINIGGDYINATKGEEKTVFDVDGNKIDTQFNSHVKVSNNYSVVIEKEGNYNIADSSNNTLLKDKYIYIEYYKNDLFIATKDAKSGIINANGNIVVPIKYSTIQKIEDTDLLMATTVDDQKIDLINASGTIIDGSKGGNIIKENNYLKLVSENDVRYFDYNGNEKTYKDLVPENKIYASNKNGKWGFVDSNGNLVVNYEYDMVTEENGNAAGIKKDGKWGIIDTSGNIVLEPQYSIPWDNVKFLSKYYEVDNAGVKTYSGEIYK